MHDSAKCIIFVPEIHKSGTMTENSVSNALKEELADMATGAKFAIVQQEGDRTVVRQVERINYKVC